MIRLINDSGVLEDEISSLDGISMDTIIQAIHAVQEQTGIAGTTAAEAATTIEGSLASAKAAWDNLLTGLANPDADMGALVDQFVSAAETAMDNMIPVLSRIGEAAGPMLASLGTAIGEHSEELVGAAVSIIHGIVNGLKGAASGMAEAMPELIMALVNALPGLANDLLDLGLTIVVGIVEGIITSLASAVGAIIDALLPYLGEIGDAIKQAFEGFFAAMDYYDPAFDEGTIGSDGYIDGIVEGVESRKGEAEDAYTGAIDTAGAAGEARAEKRAQATGRTITTETANSVSSGAGAVGSSVLGMVQSSIDSGTNAAGGANATGAAIDTHTASGVSGNAGTVNSATTGMVQGAISAGQGATGGADGIGRDIALGAASGIRAYAQQLATAAANMVKQAKEAAAAAAKTGSPSKLFRDEIGKMIAAGTAIGIEDGADWVNSAVRSVIEGARDEARDAIEGIVPDMEDSFALLNGALESQLSAIELLFAAKLNIIGQNAQATIDGIDSDIAAIKAGQERRAEEKELKEHEEKLAELRQKYNEAKAEDKAKAQKDIDDLIADWDEKQLKKQEQAEIDRLNAEKKALQEQQKAEEKALKERQKAEEKALKERLKKQEDALNEYAKAWEDGLKKLTAEHEKAMQDIASQQEGLFDKLRSGGELTYTTDAGQYRLADLSKDTKAIKTYGEELLKLRDRGVNEELWNEILGMDQAEATKFARKLNKLNDEAYAAYMQSYADKQAAAAEVAESIFGPVREATEADYLAELPGKMEEIGASAMGTLAKTMGEDGQGVINAAKTIADGVIAEFNRINSDALLKGKLMGMVMANNAELAGVVNDAWALQEANAGSSAMRQAMANGVAASGLNSGEREIVMVVNGTEFARATIGDYRAVESQSPQIRSD